MSQLEIRPLTEDDVDAFLDLLEVVAAERVHIGIETPFDRDRAAARCLEKLTSDTFESLLALEGGTLVGQMGLKDMNGLVELGMMVAPDARGRGIGSELLGAGINWARAHGAHKMTLQLWPHNDAGRALYEKFRFVQEGYLVRHWKRRSGEVWDAVVMGLQL